MVVESQARRRHTVAPGELTSLDVNLTPEFHEFAEALRDVFTMLGISLGEFAARCHRDKGAVSRYLAGKRVPQRDFVDQLLEQVRLVRGVGGISDEVGDNLRKLHLRALTVKDPKAARIQALKDNIDLEETRKNDLEAEVAWRVEEVERLKQQVWKTEQAETQRLIDNLQREVEEARAARREAEKRLATARVVAATGPVDDIGILGCIM